MEISLRFGRQETGGMRIARAVRRGKLRTLRPGGEGRGERASAERLAQALHLLCKEKCW